MRRYSRQTMIERITPEQAQQLISQGDVDVVDVRDTPEWMSGHIPVARHVSLTRLRTGAKALLPRNNVIFVCAAGQRSHMAAQLAIAAGLTNVYNLEGGTRAWAKTGYELVRSSERKAG
jgi:rhodanese-related sulfurtransferase